MLATALLVAALHAYAQSGPPNPGGGGDPQPPPTEEELATAWAAYLAQLETNRLSVLPYLHRGITNASGGAVNSMQTFITDLTMAFSESEAFSWQSSAFDEALTWATAVGLPTVITGGDGPTAYLMNREGTVPTYVGTFDVASATTINTTNVWPGGATGFALTGTNTTISQWDEASPRLTHSEFTSRVVRLGGSTNINSHSTAVAGIMAAAGANTVFSNGVAIGPAAKGMSFAANVQAWSFVNGDV